MSEKPTAATLVAYILGELPEAEQTVLEDAIFGEEDLFEQVQALKEQLLDDYAGNRLTPHQRELFERQFLASPWRRERVVFAQALADHINKPVASPTPIPEQTGINNRAVEIPSSEQIGWLERFLAFFNFSGPGWRTVIAASLLLVLSASTVWLLIVNLRLRSELAQLRQKEPARPIDPQVGQLAQELARERERNRELTAQLNRQSPVTAQPIPPIDHTGRDNDRPALFSFILSANSLRGSGERQTLTLPPLTRELELIVKLTGADKKVQAMLFSLEGDLVWQSPISVSGTGKNSMARIRLKSENLPENDYLLRISRINSTGEAAEDLGEYPFRVIKK